MTDTEIIKALELCSVIPLQCTECPYYERENCIAESVKDAVDLIQRQQTKIDELTDRIAIRAIDRIHCNIAEMNLIQEGYNIEKLKKRFRAEFEEKMELGVEDCINWADWLDSIVSELLEEAKEGGSDDR